MLTNKYMDKKYYINTLYNYNKIEIIQIVSYYLVLFLYLCRNMI